MNEHANDGVQVLHKVLTTALGTGSGEQVKKRACVTKQGTGFEPSPGSYRRFTLSRNCSLQLLGIVAEK